MLLPFVVYLIMIVMEREPRFHPDAEPEKDDLEFEPIGPAHIEDVYAELPTLKEHREKNPFPAYVTEAERITADHGYEDDENWLAMHTYMRGEFQELGKKNLSGQAFEAEHRRIEKEGLHWFIEQFPEKAAEYTELWESWARTAGLDPTIEDKEWERWHREHPAAFDMSEYRRIAQAYKKMAR